MHFPGSAPAPWAPQGCPPWRLGLGAASPAAAAGAVSAPAAAAAVPHAAAAVSGTQTMGILSSMPGATLGHRLHCPSPFSTTTHCEQQHQDSPAQQSCADASQHQVPGAGLRIHFHLLLWCGVWLELPLAGNSWLLRAARGQELQHTPRAG